MNPAVQKMKEILAAAKTEIVKIPVSPTEPEVMMMQGIIASLLANLDEGLK